MNGWLDDNCLGIIGGLRQRRGNMDNIVDPLHCLVKSALLGDIFDDDKAKIVKIRLGGLGGLQLGDG